MTKKSWWILKDDDEKLWWTVEINDKPNWPYIPNHLYRILIIGGSCATGLNKTSTKRCWQNLFVRQRFIRIKLLTAY